MTIHTDLAHAIWQDHIMEDRQMCDILDRHFDQDQFAELSKRIETVIAQCIEEAVIMNKEQPADSTHDDVIFQLSTTELIDLYRKRKDRAELVWGQLMMRVIFYERTQQENSKLVRLLRECMPHIGHTDETDLLSRVTDVLSEYEEQS